MDEKSLEVLEFPRVREILAGFTSFSASQSLALNLQPSSDAEQISLLLKQSAEARRLLAMRSDFSVGGAADVREEARMAALGKVLEPENLIDIQATLASARNARTSLAKSANELPSLWDIAGGIVPLPRVEEEIARCLSSKGDVLDSASQLLADIRRALKNTREQLLRRLEAVIRSSKSRKILQEPIITEREGRYVIPVKIEFRNDIKGIVHDVSDSGATVFVEPWATVEPGNEIRQLVVEEKREMQRVLAALSAHVGEKHSEIIQNVVLLAKLDLAMAKARYADKARAAEPVVAGGDGPRVLKLVDARHPLLKGTAVPLSVEIGADYSALVITGPNAGGKTVALKAVGLLSLMAQCGMPIPASDASQIPVFDGIFADIGDEQSIEQTLSTFSSHVSNIVRIIQNSSNRSLVLLDELGTSTDPDEGAALAQAILLHFLSRKTLTVATTHFSQLKVFAHTVPGLRNASMDFDPVTLGPTYHLTVGVPGGSNALAIAARIGLPSEIIGEARARLSSGTQEMERLLVDLMAEKKRLEELGDSLQIEKAESANLKARVEQELRRLQEEEQHAIQKARNSVIAEAAELQKHILLAAAELRKEKSRASIEVAKKAIASAHDQLEKPSWKPKVKEPAVDRDAPVPGRIGAGDTVRLVETGLRGTVVSVNDRGQVEVQVGASRLKLPLEDVEKVAASIPRAPGYTFVSRAPAKADVPLELDLRGKRADEIAPEIDSYLNDASLSHLSHVRIIHGFGTGTVRQIVRDMLASHPLVKSFRPGGKGEGGDGVTVVEV